MRWLWVLGVAIAGAAQAESLVATRVIRAAAVLTAQDVTPVDAVIPGAMTDAAEVIGLQARVAIYPGRPIRAADLGPPILITRNQVVTLRFAAGGLAILAEGRALGKGGAGEMIRVMNLQSKTTVTGRIAPDGTVMVERGDMRRVLIVLCIAGCARMEDVGKEPAFTSLSGSNQHHAMYSAPMPEVADASGPSAPSSLWSSERGALFGDRRAARRGDILTVVIEIDDSARISNTTGRSRSSAEDMAIPQLLGLPQRADAQLPDGASMAGAVQAEAESSYEGTGSVARNESLTLRIAATVVEELPNGVLRIEGQQEVRVNFELRELLLDGYVRPVDISRQNEITYDKIAGARISYGGRGQISDVQQPRYGQQITDILLPY